MAAIVAVIHDILVVVGIYSLFQIPGDPRHGGGRADRARLFAVRHRGGVRPDPPDNFQGLGASGRITYSEMVNLSMNQTLARSINTSLVAIVPVLSILLIGSLFLGATTLQSFGLTLVIGLTSGAYSSIFIASPLLAWMKEREPRCSVTIRQRLEARGVWGPTLTPAMATALAGAGRWCRSRGLVPDPLRASGVIVPVRARPGRVGRRPGHHAATGRRPGDGTRRRGAGTSRSGSPRLSQGSTRPAGNRPPPRPRKGKGK